MKYCPHALCLIRVHWYFRHTRCRWASANMVGHIRQFCHFGILEFLFPSQNSKNEEKIIYWSIPLWHIIRTPLPDEKFLNKTFSRQIYYHRDVSQKTGALEPFPRTDMWRAPVCEHSTSECWWTWSLSDENVQGRVINADVCGLKSTKIENLEDDFTNQSA